MNGRTPPLRVYRRDLTYIEHAHVTLLPLLLLQINLKGEEEEVQRELSCVYVFVTVCVCVRVEGGIDSMIPVRLPVSAECQDLPPGKTNHKAEVMDVALQDPTLVPSGWPKLYISPMHSKLNLHLDGFPGTDATKSGPPPQLP